MTISLDTIIIGAHDLQRARAFCVEGRCADEEKHRTGSEPADPDGYVWQIIVA